MSEAVGKEPQKSLLRSFFQWIGVAWRRFVTFLSNMRRSLLRGHKTEYVVFRLDQDLAERIPDIPWYYAYLPGYRMPMSLEALDNALERVARDPDLQGVIFLIKGAGISLAQAQSICALFARFRRWDSLDRPLGKAAKSITVHLEQVNPGSYVLATAADKVTMPPLTSWDVMGLRVAPTYWKETLTRLGVEFDVVKVAPWKTAVDTFTRSDMSEAERDQYGWLLESFSDDITTAISQGRNLSQEQVRALIDQAPLTAEQALAAGLIDHIAYEDQLAELFKTKDTPDQARLRRYGDMHWLLYRRPRPPSPGRVGVLSVSGTMIVGESRSFPLPLPVVGDDVMGSETVIQAIRAARQDQSLAAVVFHVDSGGGSALASDLIWRELKLLDQKKPLVVYMGNVAASGGYYIATPGRKIIAQSATLTGSIGVVIAKAVTKAARAKIGANREIVRRGENAGLYSDDDLWTPSQRDKVEDQLFSVYNTFKQRVAEGRNIPFESIDAIANGRVWSGKQALAHHLIDEIGDFECALMAACRAAGLPEDGSVRTRRISPGSDWLVAEPAKAVQNVWRQLSGQSAGAWAAALLQGEWLRLIARDPIWFITPDLPKIE